MSKKIGKIGVLTSGGDAPGMNAAIRAVVRTCTHYNVECVGIYEGYSGLIDNDFIKLDARSVANTINKGGTILRTARSKEFRSKEGRKTAYDNLKKAGIEGLVVIGGDGSFRGALEFNQEFKFPIVGVPGTIDNDIGGSDFTIGYDTALNTVIEAVDKIRDTAISHPERKDLGIERLINSLNHSEKTGKTSSIVIVAEGKTGMNVLEMREYLNKHRPEYDVRVSVIGHMQRGGSPTCADRVLATRLGIGAVDALMNGQTNVMIGVQKNEVKTVDLNEVLQENKNFDKELLRVAHISSL